MELTGGSISKRVVNEPSCLRNSLNLPFLWNVSLIPLAISILVSNSFAATSEPIGKKSSLSWHLEVEKGLEAGQLVVVNAVGVHVMAERVRDAPLVRRQQTQVPAVHAPAVALVVEIVGAVDVGEEDDAGEGGQQRRLPVGRGQKSGGQDGQQGVLHGPDAATHAPDRGRVGVAKPLERAPLQRHVEAVRLERVGRVAASAGRPDGVFGQDLGRVGAQVRRLEGLGDVGAARGADPIGAARMPTLEVAQVVQRVVHAPQLAAVVVEPLAHQPVGRRFDGGVATRRILGEAGGQTPVAAVVLARRTRRFRGTRRHIYACDFIFFYVRM